MKTQYYTSMSINGYLADENNALDWLFQFPEMKSIHNHFSNFIENIGAIAMGATTYNWVVEQLNLKQQPDQWPYNIPVWVFSHRDLTEVQGADVRLVKGDVAPVFAAMRKTAKNKNIWIVGGGDLAGQFYDHNLLDEIILTVAPVLLRSGAPLLPRNIVERPLKLTDVHQHGDTYVVLIYKVRKLKENSNPDR